MFLDRVGHKSDFGGRFVGPKGRSSHVVSHTRCHFLLTHLDIVSQLLGLQLPDHPLNPGTGCVGLTQIQSILPLQDMLKVKGNENSTKFQNILIGWPAHASYCTPA